MSKDFKKKVVIARKVGNVFVCVVSAVSLFFGTMYTAPANASVQPISVGQQEAIVKYKYMAAVKEEAKLEYYADLENSVQMNTAKEEEKIAYNEKLVRDAKKAKENLRTQAIDSTAKAIEEYQVVLNQAQKKADILHKKLKALAKKQQEQSQEVDSGSSTAGLLTNYTKYTVGDEGNSSFKSWMSYTAVTDEASPQYKLLRGSSAYTGEYGIRMVDGRYCVAMGSHYTSTIGTKVDIVLESGTVLPCVLGDQKADGDTDSLNRYHTDDGSYVEFIIDNNEINSLASEMGNFDYVKKFNGRISEIRVAK